MTTTMTNGGLAGPRRFSLGVSQKIALLTGVVAATAVTLFVIVVSTERRRSRGFVRHFKVIKRWCGRRRWSTLRRSRRAVEKLLRERCHERVEDGLHRHQRGGLPVLVYHGDMPIFTDRHLVQGVHERIV